MNKIKEKLRGYNTLGIIAVLLIGVLVAFQGFREGDIGQGLFISGGVAAVATVLIYMLNKANKKQ